MIRRVLDDPWHVFQLYAAALAAVVLAVGLAYPATGWTDNGRPVVNNECTNCGEWTR